MHADLRLHEQALAAPVLTPEQAFGAVAAALALVLAVFWPTTVSMVGTWWRVETFTHGFLVIPAVLGFVWMRRAELAAIPVRPFAWALIPLAGAGFLWLLGELSSSLAPAQLAMVAMVPSLIAAVFGWRWVRALAFPLAFLFFAVPFGEFMVPTLIDWTANFTVAAIEASGVPIYREANNFVIPSGSWSVVEACSGIRYLIASVMLGSLYAWIMYRSPLRRAVFIGAAIAVPLVANWLRAYGIVMLGHLSDNRIATGVDHLIYGWLFFGVLMFTMFWVGARWREDPDQVDAGTGIASEAMAPLAASRRPSIANLLLVAAVIAVWPVAHASLLQRLDRHPVTDVTVAPANGWTAVEPMTIGGWRPDVDGAAREQVLTFAKEGRQVTVYLALFRNQRQGSELVSSTNQLVYQENNERWMLVDRQSAVVSDAVGEHRANFGLIRGQGMHIAAAHWYWLGSTRTVSHAAAKIDLALDRLLMRGDTSAWVAVATPADESLRDAGPVLEAFVRDMGASLHHGLMEMARR